MKFMTREAWGASPPKQPKLMGFEEPAQRYVIVSHSVTMNDVDSDNYCRSVKAIQDYAFSLRELTSIVI